MKTNRSLRLVKFAVLALLTACAGASLANAQGVQYKFNLPLEVRWGQSVLPPGNYSFTLNSSPNGPPHTLVVRGEDQRAIFITSPTPGDSYSGKSALIIERHENRGTVRFLRLEDPGLVIEYPAPKAERQILAHAPALIQRLPILMASK